jgi:hypothetical protein
MAITPTLAQSLNSLPDKRTVTALTAAFKNAVFGAEVTNITRQVVADENGATIFLNLATGFVTTLPLPVRGLRYTFICVTAPAGGSYTIVTANSANIIKGNQTPVDGLAGGFSTTADTINFVSALAVAGDKVEVFSDGTSWFAYAISKVATGVTFSTAS